MKTSEAIKVGVPSIGCLDADINKYHGEEEIGEVATPTFQVLPKIMTDAEIDAELKPGKCTMSDVYAFLKNPPEGTKDVYANFFYVGNRVVGVYWLADGREWYVSGWDRDGRRWGAGDRVFSPAKQSTDIDAALKIVKEAGYIVMKQV